MVQHESVASIPNTIRFLSELLPPEPVVLGSIVRARADLSWMGAEGLRLLSSDLHPGASTVRGLRLSSDKDLEALALADSLKPGDSRIHIGHLFVAGSIHLDGDDAPTPVCFPLLTRRINLMYAAGANGKDLLATPTGDLEVTPLIKNIGNRHALLGNAPLVLPTVYIDPGSELRTRTAAWIRDALELLGLETIDMQQGEFLDAHIHPFDVTTTPGLSIVPGYGIYLDEDESPVTSTEAIRAWADMAATSSTALATLIRPDLSPNLSSDVDDGPLPMTVLGLDAEQEHIVRTARSSRMITVTGAPGTGKSRTVAALALDAVRVDRTVLLATKTHRALDVLREFFEDMPGPDPVVFGAGQSANEMAERLERCLVDHAAARQDPLELDVPGEAAVRFAMQELNEAHARALRQFDSWFPDPRGDSLVEVERRAPALAGEESRLLANELRNSLDVWNPIRRRQAIAAFLAVSQPVDGKLDTALAALEIANLRHLSGTVEETVPPGELLEQVVELLRNARQVIGESAISTVANRVRASDREQMHLLTQALRSSAVTRREILNRIDAKQVLNAEPIWLGTLDEIDEFLPPTPGLFDLVILDEASQIELPGATPALGRAKSAVIVGDPKQTRYNSYAMSSDIDAIADRYHLDGPTRTRFDVRVNSVFDAAAAISPPITLRTHYRSRLHIIDFPARRFYGGQVDVATRHPKNEGIDAITEVTIRGGEQDDAGVNHGEMHAVVAAVNRRVELARSGTSLGTVGVITPFPAQAEAITEELTTHHSAEELLSLGLQIGTVDAFQGGERDTMIISLAVSPNSSRAALMFVNDPNVFNVMITRARSENIVLTSFETPPEGLMGDYLRAAAVPPTPPPDLVIDDPWVNLLAEDLRVGGATVRVGYRVGRHVLDLVVGDGARALAIDARIDPAGTPKQLIRRLELHELGWTVVDVPEGEWSMRRAHAVAEILARVSN